MGERRVRDGHESGAAPWWRRWDGLPPFLEERWIGRPGYVNRWWYFAIVTGWAWLAVVDGLANTARRGGRFWYAVLVVLVMTPVFLVQRRRDERERSRDQPQGAQLP